MKIVLIGFMIMMFFTRELRSKYSKSDVKRIKSSKDLQHLERLHEIGTLISNAHKTLRMMELTRENLQFHAIEVISTNFVSGSMKSLHYGGYQRISWDIDKITHTNQA